ncbi:MAG: class I SAM-dependent methyltransferase [Chitinophagaceae bacterium]|nr:class I SAM-dependent methyltransferase [Chitinophagaceae bacterium]MEA3426078.1 class I SAM-dependent methyltransferase [Bacteroidota bacterium]MCA6452636.1 class I SAM-dependent methyltransferase [Chitinophagaceae bacterium]MCA6455805.1 class I SAM-dependent methyltransferase [Chitinophagaceae bacterium]MCA6459106.1 class I SAM-dependent methyltransferase [Chitinophagaceae bacterium]
MEDKQQYWDAIYRTKQPNEVSWTQEKPATSLDFIHSFHIPRDAAIIDVGGGDSRLVDYLLDEGFQNITVLDISQEALTRAQKRLGDKAGKIKWVVSDVTAFEPDTKYDVWHDRATFHFLTTPEQVHKYIQIADQHVKGYMTIGTFSDCGPDKCSGLPIRKYTEELLQKELVDKFDKIRCVTEDHVTPFNTKQNFLFCSFKKHGVN